MRCASSFVLLVLLVLLSFMPGCATLGDKDKDGIKRRDDACPEIPEDLDGFEDHDGCPEDGGSNVPTPTNGPPPPPPSGEPAIRFGGGTDKDGDGVSDQTDSCPDMPEDRDAFEDQDGCPDMDNDRDGVVDVRDACPNEPEDKDGFQDEDGCPDLDNDADGMLDSMDKCPNDAGPTSNGGCP